MVCRLTHGKKPDQQVIQPIQALQGSYALSGRAALLRKAWRMPIPDKIPYSYTGIAATLGPPQAPSVWNVGNFSVITAQSGNPEGRFNVAATGPSGYTAGGTYDALSGTDLPAGMTLSAAGMIDVGTTPATTTTNGVVFGYTEQYALPILTLHSGANAGTMPYEATVYPCEDAVPSGATIRSDDDPSLRSFTLSTWPNGSVQVAVVAGHKAVTANSTTNIALRAVEATDAVALTTTYIASLLSTGISFTNFGVATVTLNSWSSPDFIWWATSQVICARYRQSLASGTNTLEAIIDVHAYANGRAWVEVTIENCRVNMALAVVPGPGAATYTGAQIAVNGVNIHTAVNSSSGMNGTHEAFRGWYASGWVGGDPLIEVTHDANYLQAYPLFYKQYQPMTYDFTPYGNFPYTPWVNVNGWHETASQGGTGEGGKHGLTSEQSTYIGPLTGWEAAYVLTGSKLARRATVAAATEMQKFQVHYRDTTTNLVPTSAQLMNHKSGSGNPFPNTFPSTDTMPLWEAAHQPTAGLVAFLCRPSPMFIEQAQGIFAWNHTNGSHNGQFSYQQVRARAWKLRNYWHAAFVTPDTTASGATFSTWKSGARSLIGAYRIDIDGFRTFSSNTLGIVYGDIFYNSGGGPTYPNWDNSGDRNGLNRAMWENYWLVMVAAWLERTKLITDATDVAGWIVTTDWLCNIPVRWVNTQAHGGWRFLMYKQTYGTINAGGTTFTSPASGRWDDQWATEMTGTPPTDTSPFPGQLGYLDAFDYNWSQATGSNTYTGAFWAALMVAREREIAGAATAYDRAFAAMGTPHASVMATRPRYNMIPRNV